MHDEIAWQVYSQNGEPIKDAGAFRGEVSANASIVVGAAHVWFWNHSGSEIEILLQKRAQGVKSWPGYYDVTAAGHIDFGESAICLLYTSRCV